MINLIAMNVIRCGKNTKMQISENLIPIYVGNMRIQA